MMNCSLLYYTSDLKIKNTEKLFFSKDASTAFNFFEKNFSENQFLIIEPATKKEKQYISKQCQHDCTILSPPSSALKNKSELTPKIIVSKNIKKLKLMSKRLLDKNNEINIAGAPYINLLLDQKSEIIGKTVFPLFFLLISIIVLCLFRSLAILIFTMIPVISSALLSQALIKFLFDSSNIIISITPLIISILILTSLIHLIFQFIHSKSINKALKEKGAPIFYMLISTAFGFFSLLTSPLEIISTFGILTGALLILCFFLTYCYIKYFPYAISPNQISFLPKKFHFNWINKVSVFIIFILFSSTAFFLKNKIPFELDASNYFDKKERVKEKLNHITKKTGGFPILDIIIPLSSIMSNHKFIYLDSIESEITNVIKHKTSSANNLVKTINQEYSKRYMIPNSIMAFYPLYYKAPEVMQEIYPIDEYYRISILGNHISGDEYQQLQEKVEGLLKSHKLKYQLNGQYFWLMKSQVGLLKTLGYSFALTLIAISIFVIFIFRNIKGFFIFLFVNIFPIIIMINIMPFIGLSLNIATIMSVSISLGLMVDSTFHLFYENIKKEEITLIHQKTFLPIFWSNIILSALFSLFSFIEFLPVRQFGQSMALLILIGLFTDLFILPSILNLGSKE